MDKKIILKNYIRNELESKKKDLAEKERAFRESVKELKLVIGHLESQMEGFNELPTLQKTDSDFDMNTELVLAVLRDNYCEEGVILTKIERELEAQGYNDISYKKIERIIKEQKKAGRVFQTNPEAQRYKKYNIATKNKEDDGYDEVSIDDLNF